MNKQNKNKRKKRVVVFGIFDGVHDGHRDMFRQALRAASGQAKEKVELVVIVGRDSASLRWKGKKPRYSEQERLALVLKEKLVDGAVLGDEEQSTYGVLNSVQPSVICFGYDQNALDDNLKPWLQINNKDISLVRLEAFHSEIYHTSLFFDKENGLR